MRISGKVFLYSAVTLSLFFVTAIDASAATSPAPTADCGSNPTYNTNTGASFTANGVNIRTGPSTSCASKGVGYETNSVTVHCDDPDTGWFYLTDNSTGVTGWSSPSYVTFPGTTGSCAD